MKWAFVLIGACLFGCGAEQPAPEYPAQATTPTHADPPPDLPPPARAKTTKVTMVETPQEAEPEDPAFADAPAQSLGPQEIHILIKSLPLSLDAVRFDAIDKFLLLYAPYTSNKALLRQARTAFRTAKGYLGTPVSAVTLSSSVREVVALLKDPPEGPYPAKYFFAFVGALLQGVSLTKNVIADFYEQVRDGSPEGENFIWGQIGRRPDDTSIASRNIEYLTNWMNTSHN